jgi:MtN3 and saliva related transmembrane protein
MFLILFAGIVLWVIYGVLIGDFVIIAANTVSLLLLSGILFFKLSETVRGKRRRALSG